MAEGTDAAAQVNLVPLDGSETMNEDVQLYLGDCLEIMATLPASSVDAIITDPPYASGGRQQASARNIISKNDEDVRPPDEWFLQDNMGSDTYVRWMRQIARECQRLAVLGAHCHVFTDWRQFTNLVTAWESVGWTLRSVIVWDKAKGGAMGSFWRNNHEWICVFTKGQPYALPNGGFFNTWTGSKPQGGYHPTEKPLELLRYLVRSVGQTVLDPFMGSGTTGHACVLEGHHFIGIEQIAEYFQHAERRIEGARSQLRLLPLPSNHGFHLTAAPVGLWDNENDAGAAAGEP